MTIQAQSSAPPSVIKRDEAVKLNLSIGVTENSQSFFTFSGGVKAYFDSPDIHPGGVTGRNITFETEEKESFFEVRKENGYASKNATVSAQPRAGSNGAKMALIISFTAGGVPMGTKYIYEWRTEPAETPAPDIPTQPRPERPQQPPLVETPVENAGQPCGGVRFGDLHGEVNVRQYGEDDDAFIFAELTTPLRHNDLIRTRARSGAILSWTDMTTFVMKEESRVVLDCYSPKENKVKYFFGQAWVNFKKMVEDGSFEVEMAQGVAGIKGTTVIFEEDGVSSTVKVIEGNVEFRPNNGGVLMVSGGQMISAIDGRAGEIKVFDIEEEMKNWDDKTRQMTSQILAEISAEKDLIVENTEVPMDNTTDKPKKPNIMLFIIPVFILALLGGILGVKRLNKKG
ncbi:MAG: FecR domain-containing protein [Bacillota bacterium]